MDSPQHVTTEAALVLQYRDGLGPNLTNNNVRSSEYEFRVTKGSIKSSRKGSLNSSRQASFQGVLSGSLKSAALGLALWTASLAIGGTYLGGTYLGGTSVDGSYLGGTSTDGTSSAGSALMTLTTADFMALAKMQAWQGAVANAASVNTNAEDAAVNVQHKEAFENTIKGLLAQMRQDPQIKRLLGVTWGKGDNNSTLQILQNCVYGNFAGVKIQALSSDVYSIKLPLLEEAIFYWMLPGIDMEHMQSLSEALAKHNFSGLAIELTFKVSAELPANSPKVATLQSFALTDGVNSTVFEGEKALPWWRKLQENGHLDDFPLTPKMSSHLAYTIYQAAMEQMETSFDLLAQQLPGAILPEDRSILPEDTEGVFDESELDFTFSPLINHTIDKIVADDSKQTLTLEVTTDLLPLNEYSLQMMFDPDITLVDRENKSDILTTTPEIMTYYIFKLRNEPLESRTNTFVLDFSKIPGKSAIPLAQVLYVDDFFHGYATTMLDATAPNYDSKLIELLRENYLVVRFNHGLLEFASNPDFTNNQEYLDWINLQEQSIPFMAKARQEATKEMKASKKQGKEALRFFYERYDQKFWQMVYDHNLKGLYIPDFAPV